MKANLHWIKKLLQVSFVPAEIRPGKSFPEIYMVPPPKKKKPTSLHVLLVFAPVVWLCHKESKKLKKPRENQKHQTKQYSRTLAKAKIQKTSRKPKKTKKTQYSRTLAKVKRQKSKKPRENQKKQKKKKNNIPEVWRWGQQARVLEYCFFWFFRFSRGFLDFCIFTFARVLEYCVFFWFFFFGFLEVFLDFCFCKSPGILFFVFFWFLGFLEVF